MKKSERLRVTAFTGGVKVPSARFRVRELIPHLAKNGIEVTEKVPFISKYPPSSKLLRPFWLSATVASRVPGIISSYNSDITLLQREFVSTLVTLEKFTRSPRILDVDDAIHIHRNGNTARKLASYCDLVFCGNEFLAEWYDTLNIKTALIPTGIDANRFRPKSSIHNHTELRIGWTGSSSNLKYLYEIEPALKEVLKKRPNANLSIICDQAPEFKNIKSKQIDYHKWHINNEVKHLQDFDIGIMPLTNSDWERGKCAFKILQYMSCSIPVVASPIGVNSSILENDKIGLAATTQDEWIDSLVHYLDNKNERVTAGQNGRETILSKYDAPIISSSISQELNKLLAS